MLPLKRGRRCLELNYESTFKPSPKSDPFPHLRENYAHLKDKYLREGYSQKLQIMIRQVLELAKFSSLNSSEPLLDILEATVKKLLISEMELVGFFVLFRKLNLSFKLNSLEELIKLVFLKSKILLDKDENLINFLMFTMKTEIKDYDEKLIRITNKLDLHTEEINYAYRLLSNAKFSPINYNFYIDEILRNSPPYKINEKIFTITKRLKSRERKIEGLKMLNIQDKLESLCNEALVEDRKNEIHELDLCSLMPMTMKESGILLLEHEILERFAATSECLSNMSPRLDENEQDLIII